MGVPDGLYAAISPDLGFLRGKPVKICYAASCVVVSVIDCLCSRMGGVDLYGDAFVKLAPLPTGKLKVIISWQP